jgi:hypothetical protein
MRLRIVLYEVGREGSEEFYDSVPEAVQGARTWYKDLAGDKLPPWNYDTKTFLDLQNHLEAFLIRLADALGCGDDRWQKLQLRVTDSGHWT